MAWTLRVAGGGRVPVREPLAMGILNATPDSFSDGGRLGDPQERRRRIEAMVEAGAGILDVGGESTRPGHTPVAADAELRRVLPVLADARRVAPDLPVSIDTRKAAVAQAALETGASFVNDVSALGDPAMAGVVARAGCSVVLMRHRGLAGDLVPSCALQLAGHVAAAEEAGIPRDAILVDPGLGFGDPPGGDPAANLRLLTSVPEWSHGLPAVVGASRKRFVGALSGVAAAGERVAGSVAAAVLAVQAGAAVVRVHDVAETVQALRVSARARRPRGPAATAGE